MAAAGASRASTGAERPHLARLPVPGTPAPAPRTLCLSGASSWGLSQVSRVSPTPGAQPCSRSPEAPCPVDGPLPVSATKHHVCVFLGGGAGGGDKQGQFSWKAVSLC